MFGLYHWGGRGTGSGPIRALCLAALVALSAVPSFAQKQQQAAKPAAPAARQHQAQAARSVAGAGQTAPQAAQGTQAPSQAKQPKPAAPPQPAPPALAQPKTPASQKSQQLSLADAVRLAEERSPLTQEAQARLQQATAQVAGARALEDPIAAVTAPWGYQTGQFDQDVIISQTLQLNAKRRPRIARAQHEREAALADTAVTRIDLAYEARQAYYEALRADALLKVASESLATSQAFYKTAQTQFQAGEAPRSNVVRSHIDLTQAQQEKAVALGERANRYAALRSLLGLPPDAPVTLTNMLTYHPVSLKLAQLEALALRDRPDLHAAQMQLAARKSAVSQAKAENKPDVFWEAYHQNLDPFNGGNSVGVGVTWPLMDLGRRKADTQAAQAAVKEQQNSLSELQREARLNVETAYNDLVQAQQVVEGFTSGRLSRAAELLDMAQTGYANGAMTYLELLDAQSVWQSEEADYARALAGFNIAKAALEHAVGGELP